MRCACPQRYRDIPCATRQHRVRKSRTPVLHYLPPASTCIFPPMSTRVGVGQFFAWDGGCLFIGHHDRPIAQHSHQAIQLMAASEGTHRVRATDDAAWITHSVTGIPARAPHAIDVTDSDYGMVVLIEPETVEGRAIMERYLTNGIAEISDTRTPTIVRSIFDRWLAGNREDTVAEVRGLVQHLAADARPPVVTDPRVLSAITFITGRLHHPITLEEVASHVCLSPGRFRHLFSEQIGMGLRPYLLWRRFILVWGLLMKGHSLSEAAHAAGFSDSAHLSRTSTRHFGFAPSNIQVQSSPPDPGTLPPRKAAQL